MGSAVFGDYELLERIGVGGMAEVFRARARRRQAGSELVAIKRIHPRFVQDPMFVDMFVHEATVAAQLEHANIARVFDLGCVRDRYFIAMEHVHGRDLRSVFVRSVSVCGPVPIPQVCYLAMKICHGLQYIHSRHRLRGQNVQLIHRDISMPNVLLSFDGEVKIIDFGVAKLQGSAALTLDGMVKGKLAYMSPEQSRGLPLDGRSDIFATGIVMYELLTGRRLFRTKSQQETVQRIRSGKVVPLRTYNQRVPAALEAVVLKALALHPADRFQTAGEMQRAIRRVTEQHGQLCSRVHIARWLRELFEVPYAAESARIARFEQTLAEAPIESQGRDGTTIGWAPRSS